MAKDYVGYSLFEKVIIVAKNIIERYDWEDSMCIPVFGDRWQGYVVDPSNKSMLKSALEWGRQSKSIYVDGKFSHSEEIPPVQYEFDNSGWELELLRTAGGSSQGGKLSFWDCKLTKDDKVFEIGINADLLLDVLKAHNFKKGKCDTPLMFARCKGGVGLLSEKMEEYKQALADMQKKETLKTKKTSKHQIGHAYSALHEVQAYLGDLWAWYEPVVEKRGYWEHVVGFRRLKEPVKFHWFPTLYNWDPGTRIPVSKIKFLGMDPSALRTKLPARIDCGDVIDFDLTLEEACQKFYWDELERNQTGKYKSAFSARDLMFFSTSPDHFEVPDKYVKILAANGYWIED